MALIKCTECGREVSDKAQQCPHCGCPIAMGQESKPTEATAQPKAPTKIVKKKMAKYLVFDNCDIESIKNAYRITSERIENATYSAYSENSIEPELTIMTEKWKWITLMYYASSKFKSNRVITSINQIANIEEGKTEFTIPLLDEVVATFKDVVKDIAPSVVLFEESDYTDISKSYRKAHYQHIFEKEKELQERDSDNVRTIEEETAYKQSVGFDSKKEEQIRGVAQQKKAEQAKRREEQNKGAQGGWGRIATVIGAVAIIILAIFNFGTKHGWFEGGDSNSTKVSNSAANKWVGVWTCADSWRFELRRDKTAVVTIDGDPYTTSWDDGGNFAVVGSYNGDVWLIRSDGELFARGKDGSTSAILKLRKQ